MYRCAVCDQISQPREKINKVVTETRKVTHKDSTGKIVGQGDQIVKELGVCVDCAVKFEVGYGEVTPCKQGKSL